MVVLIGMLRTFYSAKLEPPTRWYDSVKLHTPHERNPTILREPLVRSGVSTGSSPASTLTYGPVSESLKFWTDSVIPRAEPLNVIRVLSRNLCIR